MRKEMIKINLSLFHFPHIHRTVSYGFGALLIASLELYWSTAIADVTAEDWHCSGSNGNINVHTQSHAECVSLARQYFENLSEDMYVGEMNTDIWIDTGHLQRRSFTFGLYHSSGLWFSSTGGIVADKLHPIHEDKIGQDSCSIGNPIDLSHGIKLEKITMDTGIVPFELMYRSRVGTYRDSNWSHTYSNKLVKPYYDRISIILADGRVWRFVNSTMTSYVADDGVHASLEHIENSGIEEGWMLKDSSGVEELYDSSGRLIRIKQPGGDQLDLTYDIAGRLSSILDSKQNVLVLQYDTDGRLSRLVENGVPSHLLQYDPTGNLSLVIHNDDTPEDSNNNPRRIFHYEDARFPHALTGITDENGDRYATWTYDDQGRAVSSEHANGLDKHSLAFNADGTTTVTNPLGKQTTYHFTDILGVKKVTQVVTWSRVLLHPS